MILSGWYFLKNIFALNTFFDWFTSGIYSIEYKIIMNIYVPV